jgi:putative SOS response-associated peptidase YedK
LLSATIIVGAANRWMQRFHDRMPIILDWSDAGAWLTGEGPGALLRSVAEDSLREWVVAGRQASSEVAPSNPPAPLR